MWNVSTSSGKLDYKTRLSDLYIELRKCIDRLNEYAYIFSTIEKASREKPISNQQYIEYSNRLNALDKEKSNTGRDARMVVKRFLEKLCDELKALINDIQNAQRIIINPQDRIDFETNIEGDKKLNKKSVHQAINITYLFASALLYRLGPEGDLSGGLEFQEGEKTIFNSNTSIKDEATLDDRRQKIGSLSKKSILNELEDFI